MAAAESAWWALKQRFPTGHAISGVQCNKCHTPCTPSFSPLFLIFLTLPASYLGRTFVEHFASCIPGEDLGSGQNTSCLWAGNALQGDGL